MTRTQRIAAITAITALAVPPGPASRADGPLWNGGVELLVLRPRQNAFQLGRVRSGAPGVLSDSKYADFGASTALAVDIARVVTKDTELFGRWRHIDTDETQFVVPPPGTTFLSTPDAQHTFRLNQIDVGVRTLAVSGTAMELSLTAGLRAAGFEADFQAANAPGAPLEVNTRRLEYDGLGGVVGAAGRWCVVSGVSLLAECRGGLIVGDHDDSVSRTFLAGGVPATDRTHSRSNVVLPVVEMRLGAAVRRTLPVGEFEAAAGYDFASWIGLAQRKSTVGIPRANGENISLDGLFLRLGLRR